MYENWLFISFNNHTDHNQHISTQWMWFCLLSPHVPSTRGRIGPHHNLEYQHARWSYFYTTCKSGLGFNNLKTECIFFRILQLVSGTFYPNYESYRSKGSDNPLPEFAVSLDPSYKVGFFTHINTAQLSLYWRFSKLR